MNQAVAMVEEELDNVVINGTTIDVRVIEKLEFESHIEVTVCGKGVYLMVSPIVGQAVHLVNEANEIDSEDFVVDSVSVEDRGTKFVTKFYLDK